MDFSANLQKQTKELLADGLGDVFNNVWYIK